MGRHVSRENGHRADGHPFAEKYPYWSKEQGLHPANAKRNVARALAAARWSLWKSGHV